MHTSSGPLCNALVLEGMKYGLAQEVLVLAHTPRGPALAVMDAALKPLDSGVSKVCLFVGVRLGERVPGAPTAQHFNRAMHTVSLPGALNAARRSLAAWRRRSLASCCCRPVSRSTTCTWPCSAASASTGTSWQARMQGMHAHAVHG